MCPTGPGAKIAYRADERFAFCSTVKGPLAAVILQTNPLTHLDKVIRYTRNDIRPISPIYRATLSDWNGH